MQPYKLIVAGSRDFNDIERCEEEVKAFFHEFIKDRPLVIVSGTARGADRCGEVVASRHPEIVLKQFPADWAKHGKSAGYRRNSLMADYADGLLALWDGTSRGTGHMISIAKAAGLQVKIVNYLATK